MDTLSYMQAGKAPLSKLKYILLIPKPKHVVGIQKNCLDEFFLAPKHMFKLADKIEVYFTYF